MIPRVCALLVCAALVLATCSAPREAPSAAAATQVAPAAREPSVAQAPSVVAQEPQPSAGADLASDTARAEALRVLAREQAWRGGAEALSRIHDLTLEGTLTVDASPGAMRVQISREGLITRFARVGPATWLSGIDAAGGWFLGEKGTIEPASGSDLGGLRLAVAHYLGWHLGGEHGFDPRHLGRTTFDGVECDRVRLFDKGDGGFDELVAMDGALLATHSVAGVMETGGEETVVRYSDWREINGCRFAFREEIEGRQKLSTVWQKISVDQGLDADAFKRPSAFDMWRPVLEEDVVLPIELSESRHVLVRGQVNGVDVQIVVDSGFSICGLDSSFASSLGLTLGKELDIAGIDAAAKARIADDVSISIGPLKMPPQRVAVIDFTELKERSGLALPVIVGLGLFTHFAVTIDYPGRRLVIHDARRYEPPATAVSVNARRGDLGYVMIEAQLEDLAPAWYVLDSGSSDAVSFNVGYTTAQHLVERYPRHIEVPSFGVGGGVLVQETKCASFTLAGHAFHDVPIQLSIRSGGVSGVIRAAGMIGAAILSRFVVTFDLPHGRILFEPADSMDSPFDRDRLGISLYVRDDRAIVDFVLAGSPAEKAGIATGMQLVEIDGMQLDGGELRDRLRKLRVRPAGTLIRLGESNGRRFLVELADSY